MKYFGFLVLAVIVLFSGCVSNETNIITVNPIEVNETIVGSKPVITQRVETANYIFYAPNGWKYSEEDAKFASLDSYFFYGSVYNGNPLIANLWSLTDKQKYTSIESATEKWIEGIKSNSDRVFYPEFPIKSEDITLKNGVNAKIIHSNFYRKEKDLNQSRYDLLVHDERNSDLYSVTFSFQYYGTFDGFEEYSELTKSSRIIFKTFELNN